MKPTPKQVDEFLSRTVEGIVGEKELRAKLLSGKKLRIKFGVDVTAPFIHSGHAVNIWMMRTLQEWGHQVIFLVGDMTTKIGDPTGKSQTRGQISNADIKKWTKDYIKQVGQILKTDKSVFEIRKNSEWFESMKVEKFLELLSLTTHAQLIERDMFQKRLKEKKQIHIHEMLYPILQGYDSYVLKSDLTIVGNDQLFNEQMGRFYQERLGQAPQAIITTKITPGLDGKEKQSKSLGNYIAITDSPDEMYGKIMSLPDPLIYSYFEVYTEEDLAPLKSLIKKNPMEAKKLLGRSFVKRYYDAKKAEAAQERFTQIFSAREMPTNIPEKKLAKDISLLDLLANEGLVASKSEAKRLIDQGGIKINGETVIDHSLILNSKTPATIQVGKRRFLKVK